SKNSTPLSCSRRVELKQTFRLRSVSPHLGPLPEGEGDKALRVLPFLTVGLLTKLAPIQIRIVQLPVGAIERHDFEDVVLRLAKANFRGKDARVALVGAPQPARDVIFAAVVRSGNSFSQASK